MNLFSTTGSRTLRQPWRTGGVLTALLVLFFVVIGCAGNDAGADEAAGEGDVQYQIGEPLADSTLAATVTSEYGTDTLTTEAFRAQIAMVTAQFPQIVDDADQFRELRRSLVEDFLLRHAVFGEADRLGLTVDTARVEGQLRQYRAQAGDDATFQQMLAANNMTEDSLRQNVRDYLRQQMVLEKLSEQATDPSEAELASFRKERAEQIQARHILFLTQNASPEEQETIQKKASAVLDSIRKGQDFEALARRHSEDGTAATGGDLGFFSRGQMVAPFEKAAFALKDSGDVTKELVKTRYGYHIIQLAGRRTGAEMDTTRARAMMMQERRQEAVEQGINALRGKLQVRINPTVVDADLNKRLENL